MLDPKLPCEHQLSKDQVTFQIPWSCSSWNIRTEPHGKVGWPMGFVHINPCNICLKATKQMVVVNKLHLGRQLKFL